MEYQKKLALLPIVGLDTSKPADYIDDRSTPLCRNIAIDRMALRKRIGSSAVGDSASDRILAYRELYTNSSHNLLQIGNTTVKSMNYSTGAWTDRASAVLTATSDTYRVDTALPVLSGSRILTFTNFKDSIRKWVGGSVDDAVLGGSPPRAKYMIDYATYLVLAYVNEGASDLAMQVRWSDTGDPENWDMVTSNSGSTNLTEDGADITGLGIFGNYLTVHKESSIYLGYLVSTSSIFKFERKNTGSGTVCFATIQNLPTGHQAYLARDGIHLFNGVSSPLIESPIMDELKAGLNPEKIHTAWSVVVSERDEYWVGIAMGSETTPDTVYKYNYKTGQCYKDTRSGITAVGKYTVTSQKTWGEQEGTWAQATGAWDDVSILALFPNLIYGSSTGVASKRDNVNNDIDAAINATWESKDFEAGEKGMFGRWLQMEVWARGGTLVVDYSTDRGSTWTYSTTLTLGADYPDDDSPLMVYFDFVSTKCRIRFSNAVASETFSIKQYIIYYSQREARS